MTYEELLYEYLAANDRAALAKIKADTLLDAGVYNENDVRRLLYEGFANIYQMKYLEAQMSHKVLNESLWRLS